MLGCSKDELLKLSLNKFFANPEQANEINKLLRSEGEVEDTEVELVSRNMEKIQAILSLSMEMDESDNLYIQGIIHDITNLKRAEKATLQAEKLGAAKQAGTCTGA